MYEVELKTEINSNQKENLKAALENEGFKFGETVTLNDYYVEAKESSHGGYDLKRYRREGDKHFYTEKIWHKTGDTLARKEDEHEVTKEEFEAEISKYPEAIKILKDRDYYKGKINEDIVTVVIDNVKFNHSPDMRYFFEAEVGVKDIEHVKEKKDFIRGFMSDLLGVSEFIDAPGMFTMAIKGL